MIKLLIKEIVLYDDHVDIFYKLNNRRNPDELITHQDFVFYTDYYKCNIKQYHFGSKPFPVNLDVFCYL